jgi:hypothetical protein
VRAPGGSPGPSEGVACRSDGTLRVDGTYECARVALMPVVGDPPPTVTAVARPSYGAPLYHCETYVPDAS